MNSARKYLVGKKIIRTKSIGLSMEKTSRNIKARHNKVEKYILGNVCGLLFFVVV